MVVIKFFVQCKNITVQVTYYGVFTMKDVVSSDSKRANLYKVIVSRIQFTRTGIDFTFVVKLSNLFIPFHKEQRNNSVVLWNVT